MRYEIWFKLANEEKENETDFTEAKYKNIIENAITNFNNSGNVARNRKHIFNHSIDEHVIKIFFESDVELEAPTKSFRFFSKNLIDNSNDFKALIIGGRLLKGVYTSIYEDGEPEQSSIDISDEQMISTLIRWCMSKEVQSAEEKKNKANTIGRIKALIMECEKMSK
nr:hypothetical protein [uncultured Eisenbergiella sp.]